MWFLSIVLTSTIRYWTDISSQQTSYYREAEMHKPGPKMSLVEREPGLIHAINIAGSAHALARLLGISPTAVLSWKRIPASRLLKIEEVTKIPREKLRPDLYRGNCA
jgi:hypothetical protein